MSLNLRSCKFYINIRNSKSRAALVENKFKTLTYDLSLFGIDDETLKRAKEKGKL